MAEKKSPIGICDLCGDPIADPYTTKGKPRLYCSAQCRNTANSRAGARERSRKAKQRVATGAWQNPHHLNPPTPEEQARRARLGRKREVEAGAWRNPALSDGARKKLSQPRKHDDNPILHSALEKLRQGLSVTELTPGEQEAHRTYRRELRSQRRSEANAYAREYYRKRQAAMTPEQREAQREKWRKANRRKAQKRKKKD